MYVLNTSWDCYLLVYCVGCFHDSRRVYELLWHGRCITLAHVMRTLCYVPSTEEVEAVDLGVYKNPLGPQAPGCFEFSHNFVYPRHVCWNCAEAGELIVCSTCSRRYHAICVLEYNPSKLTCQWQCPECRNVVHVSAKRQAEIEAALVDAVVAEESLHRKPRHDMNDTAGEQSAA